MNKHSLSLLLSALLFSAGLSQGQQPTTPPATKSDPPSSATTLPPKYPLEAWKPLVTKEGNFSILFPVAVKGETSRFQLQGGFGVETRFVVPTAEGNYQAAFTFLSENLATPQGIRERFTTLVKTLKQNEKVKWISGGEIDYAGNPGVEFKVQMSETRVTIWSRQYFAYGCVYEITARYLFREPELKEPQMFLDSFKLLGPPSQRPVFPAPQQETLPDFTPLAQNLYYVSPETLRKQALQPVEPDFSKKAPFWEIKLRVTVSPEGKVIDVDFSDTMSSLHNDAIKAAKKWTFTPFRLAGKPVAVQGQLVFKSSSKGTTKLQ